MFRVKKPIRVTVMFMVLAIIVLSAVGCSTPSKKVVLFVASSMIQPIDEFSRDFKTRHPDIEIIREAGVTCPQSLYHFQS
tara:strand:+ start:489 stop:728 length:240 start_codon:yes stop_codon:yes gene_type:complete